MQKVLMLQKSWSLYYWYIKQQDPIYQLVPSVGLFYIEFSDAIQEGDGERVL